MEKWLADISLENSELEPHPKLRPYIRSYSREFIVFYVNFFEPQDHLACAWIQNFLRDCFDIECFYPHSIAFTPEMRYKTPGKPTLIDNLPYATGFSELSNVPCFRHYETEEVTQLVKALRADAKRIAKQFRKHFEQFE